MLISSLDGRRPESGSSLVRAALFAALAVAVAVAVSTLPVGPLIETLRSWMETSGSIGMVGFGVAYVVLALAFVPGAALTMVAGAVFGLGWGLLVVAIATSVADAVAFLTGRYVARNAVLRLMDRYPLFKIVDRTISRGGWRIVALIRLSPALPYSASNYLFGVTSVPFFPFLISSGIFTLPGALAYLYLGYVGAETVSSSGRNAVEWALLSLGLAVTFVAIWYVTVLARRTFAKLK